MTNNFPFHIEWLHQRIAGDLSYALERDRLKITCAQAIEIFCSADPSQKKGGVDWIAKTYINGGFLWDDVESGENSKVYQTLTDFAQFRKQLNGTAKNLSHYQCLSDVYVAIRNFITLDSADESTRALKRKERDLAIAESDVLYRSSHLIVAVPLTERASCWWGRGTQWCTASTTSTNYFNHYNRNAPLIIALFPKGLKDKENSGDRVRKFQLWVTKGDIQFMDETDAPILPEFIHDHWEEFKPLVEWAMEQNSDALKWFKPESIDQEWLIGLIKNAEVTLDYVPTQAKNIEVCSTAIQVNSFNLAAVPIDMITEEMCSLVEPSAWANLTVYLPEKFQIKTRVFSSLNRSLLTIKKLSLNHIESEDVLQLLTKTRNHNHLEMFLGYIVDRKPSLLTSDVLMSFVQSSPLLISEIPMELKSKELCEFVIQANPVLITNVPVKYWNSSLIEQAVNDNPHILNVIPADLVTQKIVDAAINSARYDVDYSKISSKWLDRDRYLKIVTLYIHKWKTIPENLIDQEFCDQAFEINTDLIVDIPEQFIRDEWWMQAALKNCGLVKEMPDHLHTEENYINLVRNGAGGMCAFLNPKFISPLVAWVMVDTDPTLICFVPFELRTLEICERAVGYIANLIAFVPEALKDQVLNRLAILPEIFEYTTCEISEEDFKRFESARNITPVEPPRWNADILVNLKNGLERNIKPQSEDNSFTPE